MQTLPHLGKRGNVYQWRRRSRRQSTGIVDLKLSLGTTNLRTALILSRKISAESDIVMEQLEGRQITPQDARAWLSLVVRRERDKIEKLKMLRRFDAGDPEDDLRHDEAARTVWQHIADKGLNAPLPKDACDNGLLKRYINMFRADLTSDARTRIVSRDFRDLTGHQSLSAFQIITLMNLVIEGKAAAWARHDSILSPMTSAAEQMLDEDHGLLGPQPSTQPAYSPQPDDLRPQAQPATTVPVAELAQVCAQAANTDAAMAEPDQPEVEVLDSSIAAVVRRMNAIKRAEKIEEKNLRQYESFATLFTLLTGISDVRQIRQPDQAARRQKIPR